MSSRIFTLLFLSLCSAAVADEEATNLKPERLEIQELARTLHSLKINGETIEYDAISGMLPLDNSENKCQASMFYTAYFKKVPQDSLSSRPLMFCFNGGPGSSSVWLHMGLLGPKIVQVQDAAFTPPPSTYKNNPYTLLDTADLVFIDPISTGFSKAAPGIDPKQFHSIEGDAESFAEFIRLFLTHFRRWQSPKYLMGESYGTIRAVCLANYLHDVSFIDVNGIVLISMCLDFQAYDFGNGNDLPYILNLPTYAACAWYHKKLPHEELQKPLTEFLQDVEKFSIYEYATALLLGDSLDKDTYEKVLKRLAHYTGLKREYLKEQHLRVISANFYRELLRPESKVIGRFDGRYTAFDSSFLEDPLMIQDPSFEAITGPFTSAFNQYLANDLKVEINDPYYILNGSAVFPWSFSIDRTPPGLGYLYMSGKLRTLVERNPSLNVLVLSGIYDLATPYFAANYTLNHLKLAPSQRQNIQVKTFEAGHMMYLNPPSHAQIKTDLVKFLGK